MTEDVFRIVITAAVALAAIAFVVQAGVLFALYRVTRKAQGSAESFMKKVEPVLARAEPAIEKAGNVIERAGPVIDRLGPVIAKLGTTIDKVGPVLDRAVPAIEKVGPALDEARESLARAGMLIERANEIAANTNLVIEEARPQITHLSQEALEIVRLGREQVERVGDLLHDAAEKARTRLEQIDHSVESTIEQVEQVGGAMKRAVLKPVREVNGLAAGISAAVSLLVHGHRKSSVDAATQDEEMFI